MENNKTMKKRIEWLDVMKGILITFVILSHSYPADIYRYFFTPFFLTMFFFASGYTFSLKGNWKEYFCHNFRRLGIPFLVLGGIRVFIQYAVSGGDVADYIKKFFMQISGKGDEMWFVSCLITASVLFYIILRVGSRISESNRMFFIVILSIIVMGAGIYDIIIVKLKLIWEFELACLMIFYMMLGYLYRRLEVKIQICEKRKWIVLCSVVYLAAVFRYKNQVDIHLEQFEHFFLWFLLSILSVGPVIYISMIISNRRIKDVLIFLGQNTLFYYAFAGIIRMILYKGCNVAGFLPDMYIFPVVCVVLSEAVLSVPAKFVNKICPWMVGKKRIAGGVKNENKSN